MTGAGLCCSKLSLLPPCPRLFFKYFQSALARHAPLFSVQRVPTSLPPALLLHGPPCQEQCRGLASSPSRRVRLFELMAVAGCSALLHLLSARRQFVSGSGPHDILKLLPRSQEQCWQEHGYLIFACCLLPAEAHADRKYVKVYASPQRVPPL